MPHTLETKQEAPRVRLLDERTINQIAAGEVIENPASVVKELLENAIDAGSSSVTVEIQEGGRELIRLSDNGCGMPQDDALLSLERHATSKIRQVHDIESILTMGFRGEALPSIASISKFRLLTSTGEGNGTLIIVEGGKILSCVQAPRSKGTTIEVKSLFFNVPVRRKFQKSPSIDEQEVLKVVTLLSLAYPEISIELISNGIGLVKPPLTSAGLAFDERLKGRIEHLLGSSFASSLLPLSLEHPPYALTGYISKPETHRPNRTGQFLFINRRAVQVPAVAQAIREGYGPMLPAQRYPLFVLHLDMPGDLLDVNVHPQKKEVRLREEALLKEALLEAVQKALLPPAPVKRPPVFSESATLSYTAAPIAAYWAPHAALREPQHPFTAEKQVIEEPWQRIQQELPRKIEVRVMATIAGQILLEPYRLPEKLFGKLSKEGGLARIDQQKAYRRIHYEKLLHQETKSESQLLLIPKVMVFSPPEAKKLEAHASLIGKLGFELRFLGEGSVAVDALPSFIRESEVEAILFSILEEVGDRQIETIKQERLIETVMRHSLSTTERLSLPQAQALVEELLACESPSKCPQGKPLAHYISPDEWGYTEGSSKIGF